MKNKSNAIKIILTGAVILIALITLSKTAINERSIRGLERSFSEIYNDRLLVESYIYKLNDLLYKKKILLMDQTNKELKDYQELNQQTQQIVILIDQYKLTKLTRKENQLFAAFTKTIGQLKAAEMKLGASTGNHTPGDLLKLCDTSINQLQSLSQIQIAEGKELNESSHKILSGSLMAIKVEWATYFILLMVILSLLRNRILKSNSLRLHLN